MYIVMCECIVAESAVRKKFRSYGGFPSGVSIVGSVTFKHVL